MEPLLYRTIGRMAALRPRSTLAYLSDKPRGSLRDASALHPVITINQGFLIDLDCSILKDVLLFYEAGV